MWVYRRFGSSSSGEYTSLLPPVICRERRLFVGLSVVGIQGALNVTDKMEALAAALNLNKVNAGWEKLAYLGTGTGS